MSSINRVVLTGGLTRDPELRSTSGGMSVLSMRLAFSSRGKNPQSGQWEDMPNYIDVTMFGDRAQRLSTVLKKGSSIGVDGKLRWREWESQSGEKRQAIEIIADDIEFVGGGRPDSPSAEGGAEGTAAPVDDLEGEEIPF